MYETRLQDTALGLQRFQDLWNRMFLKVLEGSLKLWIGAKVIHPPREELVQKPREIVTPVLMPLRLLPIGAMTGYRGKSEFPCWGMAHLMQLCKCRAEVNRIR